MNPEEQFPAVTKGLQDLLLPLACLPDIEFFCLLQHAPKAVLEIHETYPKQTCRNRYRIATANGILTLTVPVIKTLGNHTPMQAVKIDLSEKTNRIHWRAIESAYNKSPFFLYYRDEFEKIFLSPPELLIEFNQLLLDLCIRFLKVNLPYHLTEQYSKVTGTYTDLRNQIMPKQRPESGGFVKEFETYIQVFSDRHEFIPNLSIIDLLFNLGPDAAGYLKRHVPEISQNGD